MENHLVGDAGCAFVLPRNTQLLGYATISGTEIRNYIRFCKVVTNDMN